MSNLKNPKNFSKVEDELIAKSPSNFTASFLIFKALKIKRLPVDVAYRRKVLKAADTKMIPTERKMRKKDAKEWADKFLTENPHYVSNNGNDSNEGIEDNLNNLPALTEEQILLNSPSNILTALFLNYKFGVIKKIDKVSKERNDLIRAGKRAVKLTKVSLLQIKDFLDKQNFDTSDLHERYQKVNPYSPVSKQKFQKRLNKHSDESTLNLEIPTKPSLKKQNPIQLSTNGHGSDNAFIIQFNDKKIVFKKALAKMTITFEGDTITFD